MFSCVALLVMPAWALSYIHWQSAEWLCAGSQPGTACFDSHPCNLIFQKASLVSLTWLYHQVLREKGKNSRPGFKLTHHFCHVTKVITKLVHIRGVEKKQQLYILMEEAAKPHCKGTWIEVKKNNCDHMTIHYIPHWNSSLNVWISRTLCNWPSVICSARFKIKE